MTSAGGVADEENYIADINGRLPWNRDSEFFISYQCPCVERSDRVIVVTNEDILYSDWHYVGQGQPRCGNDSILGQVRPIIGE